MLLTKNFPKDAAIKSKADASGKNTFIHLLKVSSLVALISIIFFAAISYYKHPVAVITGISMLPNYTQDEIHVTTRVFSTPERFRVVLFDSEGIQNPTANDLREKINIKGNFAKRVIGVPGDKIKLSLDTGLLISLNGEKVNHSSDLTKPTFDVVNSNDLSVIVPALYLNETIGDQTHAIYSLAIPKSEMNTPQLKMIEESIIPLSTKALNAKVAGSVAQFTVPEGQLFLVSDNRVDGLDSRQLGFVPVASVISIFEEK